MTLDELTERVITLEAQRLATRTVIVWIATAALVREDEPGVFLRYLSEAMDKSIANAMPTDGGGPDAVEAMRIAETMSKEKDWIVGRIREAMGT